LWNIINWLIQASYLNTFISFQSNQKDPYCSIVYLKPKVFVSAVDFILCFFFQDKYVSEEVTHKDGGPLMMNAFEMITLSQGLDLSALFDRQQVICNSF
jgi:hypothetical protein